MKAADFKKLSDAEKEHYFQRPKCGEFVDKRELRDVIFHQSDHNPEALALPRIIGKPIRKPPSRR
jgi:hypothetical protein